MNKMEFTEVMNTFTRLHAIASDTEPKDSASTKGYRARSLMR